MHQAYRSLKTFIRWLRATQALNHNPLADVSIRMPATLPRVPTEDKLRAVMNCCPQTPAGARNRALVHRPAMVMKIDLGRRRVCWRRMCDA